jgi:hypothetical protein
VSAFWIAPLVVTVVGLLAVVGFTRQLAEEVAEVRRALGRVADLRPAVIEVRSQFEQFRRR